MLLNGRYAVVTGGSRGIGYQICRVFLENGAKVLAVSRDPAKLAEAQRTLPGLEVLAVDMSASSDIDRAVAWAQQQWGKVDILVNNAGISPQGDRDLVLQDDAVFDDTLRVNITGPHLTTKRFVPLLLASDDARVVNLGSTSGVLAPALTGAYAVSKAGLHALTIAWANALSGRVPVNAMSPGWVRTDMSPNAPGDPRDSAATALWLVTQPRDLTGQFVRDTGVIGWMPLDVVAQVAALNRQVNQQ